MLEIFQGYWQIKMHESCNEMKNFICRHGTFQFEVIPFGLKYSAATFQNMMDSLMANVCNVKCYVDDVVVHSASVEEHVQHLEKVMSLLRKHRLHVRLRNCFFMRPRVQLLGHVIDECGVHTDEYKLHKIRDAQPPGDARELRSFLGLASHYRRFIKESAKIASPLSEKTLTKVDFGWTSEMQEAFETLKQALITAPVLAYLDFTKPFIVATDALNRPIRAVLSQKDENGRDASRGLNDAEKNYSTDESEGLAIAFALKKPEVPVVHGP